MKLKTEQNTPRVEALIRRSARAYFSRVPMKVREKSEEHSKNLLDYVPVFEHDQWFIVNNETGASWSVHDADGPDTANGFCFERL